ncbi:MULTISPECIES: type VI secretion system protein TssL, short form [Pseudomonas]|uniref:type VI secretion system protein TssL, short form n=1 Tax=Pseudomonas TaxID=286 RepID=UPI001BE75E29|nr:MULTISPECIES: type VI secretion system protein TssL, short form [Pseudomonas]MBT2337755.1 type VI secretion system protein TssL, short form [Pseudomonas fluorescens]MCD4532108.1 type VI secretion system protein TssL, short form [Pseudomonas sp. C3-2018]
MTLLRTGKQATTALDIDDLLHDTYLMVVELRQGASVPDLQKLRELCVAHIEQVRQRLEQTGFDQRSADHISHAQCALLDETVLTVTPSDMRTEWAGESLQAKFFNRHQAGEFLYEDMREVLREPAPDPRVLTAFQRVLSLGFRGRYKKDVADPEREQILAALNAHVAPLQVNQDLVGQAAGRNLIGSLPRGRSPWVHALLVVLLLAGVWWAMDHLLNGVVASLLPVGA